MPSNCGRNYQLTVHNIERFSGNISSAGPRARVLRIVGKKTRLSLKSIEVHEQARSPMSWQYWRKKSRQNWRTNLRGGDSGSPSRTPTAPTDHHRWSRSFALASHSLRSSDKKNRQRSKEQCLKRVTLVQDSWWLYGLWLQRRFGDSGAHVLTNEFTFETCTNTGVRVFITSRHHLAESTTWKQNNTTVQKNSNNIFFTAEVCHPTEDSGPRRTTFHAHVHKELGRMRAFLLSTLFTTTPNWMRKFVHSVPISEIFVWMTREESDTMRRWKSTGNCG